MHIRHDDELLLIRIDWSKIIVGKAKQIADFIIVSYDWNQHTNHFDMKVHHYLSKNKDSDVALSALASLMPELRRAGRTIKRLVIISDGGPSDFHMKKWVHHEFDIALDLEVNLQHVILAPHHSDGPCDSAKSQAARVLRNDLLHHPRPDVELAYIRDTFNGVRNHKATVLQGRAVTAYPEPGRMVGIRKCHRFAADANSREIIGYDQSLVVEDVNGLKRWPY